MAVSKGKPAGKTPPAKGKKKAPAKKVPAKGGFVPGKKGQLPPWMQKGAEK